MKLGSRVPLKLNKMLDTDKKLFASVLLIFFFLSFSPFYVSVFYITRDGEVLPRPIDLREVYFPGKKNHGFIEYRCKKGSKKKIKQLKIRCASEYRSVFL